MHQFIDAIATGDGSAILTPAGDSLDSHLLCFAAEEARLTGRVIDMNGYRQRIAAETTVSAV